MLLLPNAGFLCRADDGSEHTVIVTQKMIDASTMEDQEFVPGMKTLRTLFGQHCNFIDDNTFKIVETGQTIRKI